MVILLCAHNNTLQPALLLHKIISDHWSARPYPQPSWNRIYGTWSRLQSGSRCPELEGYCPCSLQSPWPHTCAPSTSMRRQISREGTATEAHLSEFTQKLKGLCNPSNYNDFPSFQVCCYNSLF